MNFLIASATTIAARDKFHCVKPGALLKGALPWKSNGAGASAYDILAKASGRSRRTIS